VPGPDFDHVRNVAATAFGGVLPRFAPAIGAAVAAHYEERTAIADSPLSDAVPPDPLISAAERIIAVVGQDSGDDPVARRKCLEIVCEIAEARVSEPRPPD